MEDLVAAAAPIALQVFLTVQGLKVFGVVDENAGKWGIVAGLFFGLGALVSSLFPGATNVVGIINTYVVGALSAGLFYEYLAKPVLDQFGVHLGSGK